MTCYLLLLSLTIDLPTWRAAAEGRCPVPEKDGRFWRTPLYRVSFESRYGSPRISSGNQTWQRKSPMNGGFHGKITDEWSIFQPAMFDDTGGYAGSWLKWLVKHVWFLPGFHGAKTLLQLPSRQRGPCEKGITSWRPGARWAGRDLRCPLHGVGLISPRMRFRCWARVVVPKTLVYDTHTLW